MSKRISLSKALTPIFARLGTWSVDLNHKNAKSKTAKDDVVYEAFLYALVCEVLDGLGYDPRAIPAPGVFRFRRAPGELKETPKKYSYVEFTTPTTEYELHCDTRVVTRFAGAELEIDVVIVTKAHAMECRNKSKKPSYRRVHFILEAKDHAAGLGTVEAKAFVGICAGVKVTNCGNAIVTSGVVKPNAALLLSGVKPPLLSFPQVTAAKAHQANVTAFSNSLTVQLSSVL